MIIKKLLQLLENDNLTTDLMLEGLFDNYINEDSDTMDVIISFYEASYKLTMVERSQAKQPVPMRKENTIKKLEDLIIKTSEILKSRFQPVFKFWLDTHALNNPHLWAIGRVENQEDDHDLFGTLIGEYKRYAYKNPNINTNKVYDDLVTHISYDIESYPAIEEYLKVCASENSEQQKDMMYNDLDDGVYDSDDGYEINDNHFEDYDAAKEYIDNFEIETSITLEEFKHTYGLDLHDFFEALKSYNYDLYLQALTEVYENIVFREWFNFWKQKGIVKTRETVQKVYDTMLTKHSNVAKKEMADVSIILNTAHQNGNIVRDYSESYGDNSNDYDVTIDTEVLKELSDGTFEEFQTWNNDLEESGF